MNTRYLIKGLLRTFGVEILPPLNEELAKLERVYRLPPLTPEFVAAVRLIAPHYNLTTSEKSKSFWEADQNGACWGEYEALARLFQSIPRPQRVLELGPGLGRSLVFFSKKLSWENSEIHAYEGDGSATKYTSLGPRFEDSFCGNIAILRDILDFNGIKNVRIFNARDVRMADLPGPYDFVYSFYGIGFHWSLEHFLGDLTRLMNDTSVAVFTVPGEFAPFPRLEQFQYKILDSRAVWPKDRRLKLLILGKKALPNS
jgi:Methyltransferase domain